MKATKFDIALSFAGENRTYVDQVAQILKQRGVSVFYDLFEEANMWGKNLYDYLSDVYQNQAKFTVLFISEHYNKKLWTNQERQAMQARAFQENEEYILPARFDDTKVPGVLPTIAYVDLIKKTPEQLAELICEKLIYSGGTIPSESLRKALSTMKTLPKRDPLKITVKVRNDKKQPIANAQVLLLSDNKTFLDGMTSNAGFADFNIKTRRIYTILVSHGNYVSSIVGKYDPKDDIEIIVNQIENVGSIICANGTGYVPGLEGRLNPILDNLNRKYLYADNIAIDGGKEQPATFEIDNPLELEDRNGVIMKLVFRFIGGRTSLIDFIKPTFE